MNILLVTPFPLAATGGVSTVVLRLREEFVRRGHRVSILVPGHAGRLTAISDVEGTTVFSGYYRLPWVHGHLIRSVVAFWLCLPWTLWDLHRFLARQSIEIVAVQYPLPWLLYFALLRPFSRWRIAATLHGGDVHTLPARDWLERLIVRWLLTSADAVTAVSESLKRDIRDVIDHPHLSVAVILNGAPAAPQLAPRTDHRVAQRPYLVAAGQLIRRKANDVLIEALALMRERGVSASLLLVGDGPERASLARLAAERQPSGRAMRWPYPDNPPGNR